MQSHRKSEIVYCVARTQETKLGPKERKCKQYENASHKWKWQSKDLGSNPSAVESVFFSTERFQIP